MTGGEVPGVGRAGWAGHRRWDKRLGGAFDHGRADVLVTLPQPLPHTVTTPNETRFLTGSPQRSHLLLQATVTVGVSKRVPVVPQTLT